MKTNPLVTLGELGQSIWLDYIKRDMLENGQLKKLISDDGLRGMTSNPSIFEKAIAESHDYDDAIKKLLNNGDDINKIYETLTQKDVGDAADQFRALYDKLNAEDGYVSLEVNPHLAHDSAGTIEEAQRFWKAVKRPNILIKVPATKEGLVAIKHLISEGISVNVTLLFGVTRYQEVVEAYLSGLEQRVAVNKPIDHIASVASFFLSRIDVLLDPMLEKIMAANNDKSNLAKALHGQIAIYSSKSAYQYFKKIYQSERFKKLAAKGARPQRLLWASTSTKNPAYSDVKYVEALIGPETVNTLPMETLDAYRDHGDPKVRIDEDADKAAACFKQLAELGIDIDKQTQQLEDEGVDKFNEAYDKLINSLKKIASNNSVKEK
jgi:transaldolase